MTTNIKYAITGGAALFLLSVFILFSPGGDPEKDKQLYAWDTNWAKIEFVPGAANDAEKPTPKKDEKKPPNTPPEDPNQGRLHLGFLVDSGLTHDALRVVAPRGGAPGAQPVERRGNSTVRNVFTEWGKPRIKTIYEISDGKVAIPGAEAVKVEEFGLGPESDKLLLYKSVSSEPVTITLGAKMQNGDFFFTASHKPGQLFVAPGHILGKYRLSYLHFRDQTVIRYPLKSYTATLVVEDKNGPLKLRQTREEVDKRVVSKWLDESGAELPVALGAGLDNFIKQIQINRFADDWMLLQTNTGDLEELWKKSGKPELIVRADVAGGDEYTIQLNAPDQKIIVGSDDLVLLRTSNDAHVDLSRRIVLDNILSHMEKIRVWQKTPKKNPAAGPPSPLAPGAPGVPGQGLP